MTRREHLRHPQLISVKRQMKPFTMKTCRLRDLFSPNHFPQPLGKGWPCLAHYTSYSFLPQLPVKVRAQEKYTSALHSRGEETNDCNTNDLFVYMSVPTYGSVQLPFWGRRIVAGDGNGIVFTIFMLVCP